MKKQINNKDILINSCIKSNIDNNTRIYNNNIKNNNILFNNINYL